MIVIAGIVTAGTAVAGLTNEPELEVAAIPGCSEVLPASPGFSFAIAYYDGGTYGHPDYPWLTAAKASAMSDALVRSLPADTDVEFASPSRSLVFQPIPIYPEDVSLPDGITVADISGDSRASGTLVRAGVQAEFNVGVQASDGGAPPCVEGEVDERTTLPDGTVVDVVSSTEVPSDGEAGATHRRSAIAYTADTVVSARLSDDGGGAPLPLEIGELRDIVANPQLHVSATVPVSIDPPRSDCGRFGDNPVPSLTRDVVERLGAVLDEQWAQQFPQMRTDPPIGDLLPGSSGSGSACTVVDVVSPSYSGEVTVDISAAPDYRQRGDTPPTPGVTETTLPDGTVITTGSGPADSRTRTTEWMTVRRPSNTLVQFGFGDGVDVASLVAVATAPGLEL